MATMQSGFRFDDTERGDDPRAAIFARIDDLRGPATATAVDALATLRLLAQGLAQAQAQELERVERSDPADPTRSARVQALRARIAQATAMQETAARGNARIDRWMAALDEARPRFHGFVSRRDLTPVAKARVDVRAPGLREPLRAKVDRDGYFSIPLAAPPNTKADAVDAKPDPKNARVKAGKVAVAAANASSSQDAQVQVWLGDTLLHEDAQPLPLAEGSVYREYIVGDEAYEPPAGSEPPPPPRDAPGAPRPRTAKGAAPRGRRGKA